MKSVTDRWQTWDGELGMRNQNRNSEVWEQCEKDACNNEKKKIITYQIYIYYKTEFYEKAKYVQGCFQSFAL